MSDLRRSTGRDAQPLILVREHVSKKALKVLGSRFL